MSIQPRLKWPAGVPREGKPIASRFGARTVNMAVDALAIELGRFGIKEYTLTLDLRIDRSTKAGFRMLAEDDGDQGVAVYFKRSGVDQVLAIDRYNMIQDNVWALARTIEALRQIDRDGGPSILNRALEGFAALPSAPSRCPFKELGLTPSASPDEVQEKFRELAKEAHPDHGGSNEEFTALQETRDLALASIEAREATS